MTGRQHLNRRISLRAWIFFTSLALCFALLLTANTQDEAWRALYVPGGGLPLSLFHGLFLIRCPRCHKPIGHLVRSPAEFSLLRFSKRVRFCPHCTVDFEDDL